MDYRYLLKTSLPLSTQTYEALKIALGKGYIKWADMPRELMRAYDEKGQPERDEDWREMIRSGRAHGGDLIGIENLFEMEELLDIRGYRSMEDLLNTKLPVQHDVFALLKKALTEGHLKKVDMSVELLESYENYGKRNNRL